MAYNRYWEFVTNFRARNTWYVSEDGDDATGDGSHDNPYKTIESAYLACSNMDAIAIISLDAASNESPVLNRGIGNIMLYNTWEVGVLPAMKQLSIKDKNIQVCGLVAGMFTNIIGDLVLDESLGYPVITHDEEDVADFCGLTLFRCVYGGAVIKSAFPIGIVLQNARFCKVIENFNLGGTYHAFVQDSYGIHFSRNMGVGSGYGVYFIDANVTKTITGAGSPFGIFATYANNFLMDNGLLYPLGEIWDNNLCVPVVCKRNACGTIVLARMLEAWGISHWGDSQFQTLLVRLFDEFGIVVTTTQEYVTFCATGPMDAMSWLLNQAFVTVASVVEYFTSYWSALTENEKRSGFMNRTRRNIALKPDVTPYLEEVEDPDHPGDPDYYYVKCDDEYRAIVGARTKDAAPLSFVPIFLGDLAEFDTLSDFQMFNDVCDQSSYDLDSIDALSVRSVLAPVPSSDELCSVYGSVRDLGLTVEWVEKVQMVFEAVLPASAGADPAVITKKEGIITPDYLTGDFSINLARGLKVRVVCQETGMDAEFIVPDQESAKLLDLITT